MNNQKGIGVLGIILAITGILVIGLGSGTGIRYYQDKISKKTNTQVPINKPVACTQEVKICPDGSSVERIGPNCEFAECPNTNTTASSTEQTVSTENQNISSNSLILNINAKDNYKVNEYLTGATYNINYTGPSFDAVILYRQDWKQSFSGANASSKTYNLDFREIKNGKFISDVVVLSPIDVNTKITVNGKTSTSTNPVMNYFLNEGTYTITMAVYKCSDIINTGKCSSENVSLDQLIKKEPIKSISKIITVAGEENASISLGKNILDCVAAKDSLCSENLLKIFEENLKSCKPSTGTTGIGWETLMGAYRSYNILGMENNLCVVEYSYLKTDTIPPNLLNKTMTCKYTDSERTIESVAEAKNCSGPLYDEGKKLMNQNQ